MKLHDLQALIATPEYQQLPYALVGESITPQDTWRTIQTKIQQLGFELATWEAGQYLICLFEAYPDVIKRIELDISGSSDVFKINGCDCDINYNEFDPQQDALLLSTMEETDDFETFYGVMKGLDTHPIKSMIDQDQTSYHLNLLSQTIEGCIESSQEISQRLSSRLGLIQAKTDALRLQMIAQKHLPKPPPRPKAM